MKRKVLKLLIEVDRICGKDIIYSFRMLLISGILWRRMEKFNYIQIYNMDAILSFFI
jgi:hypothetical protein